MDLCVKCKVHAATITFAESELHHNHGLTERLCVCCYVAKMEDHEEKVKKALHEYKEIMLRVGCK
jgi:hypothetical protein